MAIGSDIAIGRQCRLNWNSKTLCFARAVPGSTREIVTNSDNAICGDIDHNINRSQKGRQMIKWSLFFDITWPIIQEVFPLLGLDSTGSTGPWELGATDDLSYFPVQLDMPGAVHSIANAFVTGWSIRGSKGSRPVQMQVDISGETEESGSFSEDKVDFGAEYAFTHASLTLGNESDSDEARDFDRFMIRVDNRPVIEHNNSITVTDALIGDRQSMLATSVPYVSANSDTYFDYRDDNDGKNSVLVLNNGDKTLTFTMPAGLPIAKPASILSKMDQVRTPITMLLHRDVSGSTRVAPLEITAS